MTMCLMQIDALIEGLADASDMPRLQSLKLHFACSREDLYLRYAVASGPLPTTQLCQQMFMPIHCMWVGQIYRIYDFHVE